MSRGILIETLVRAIEIFIRCSRITVENKWRALSADNIAFVGEKPDMIVARCTPALHGFSISVMVSIPRYLLTIEGHLALNELRVRVSSKHVSQQD